MPDSSYTLQPNPALTPVDEKKEAPTDSPLNLFPKKFLIGLAIVGVLLVFFSGFFLRGAVDSPQPLTTVPTATPTPTPLVAITPTPTPFSEVIGSTIKFLPRKQYFDDTYIAISKSAPYKTAILSISRIEQERNYTQYLKVNYFNGKEWVRKTVTNTLSNSNVIANPLLRSWNDATIIEQNATKDIATLSLDSQNVVITSKRLQDEISVQSLPGSTKFIYQGTGTLTINKEAEQAYIFYARTYSFNASDLSFLSTPEILTSEWAIFWDENGTFYYLDALKTPNATSSIQDRQIGIRETLNQTITRTTTASGRATPPEPLFIVNLNDPIGESLRFPYTNAVNKSDKKSYQWYLGSGEGSLVQSQGKTAKGIGVFEYITQVTN